MVLIILLAVEGGGVVCLFFWRRGVLNYSDYTIKFQAGQSNFFCCGSPGGHSILLTDQFGGIPSSRMNPMLYYAVEFLLKENE